MNYIYVDTKITGAIFQLLEYFKSGVFNQQEFMVYHKFYKKCSRQFSLMFNKQNIKHCVFKGYSDIKIPDNSVIFYLFNAQSNCRMVANRKCKHIFVTHGESNKVSSIKPIIRIYDYVAVAGHLGINRYLHNEIFYPDDIERKKVIMVGDTFIGHNNFSYNENSQYALYAPTWEGGISEENYSSLEWDDIFSRLSNYLISTKISNLIIQPHPNLGHRKKAYKLNLYRGIELLLKNNINITLLKENSSFIDFYLSLRYKRLFKIANRNETFNVREAFSDISAMETQFYAKEIPTRIFLKKNVNWNDETLNRHYQIFGIKEKQKIPEYIGEKFDHNYKSYLLNYETEDLKNSNLNQRVNIIMKLIKDFN